MNNNLTKKTKYIQDIVFAAFMLAAAVFLFWKCRYGFSNFDESLYTAIPYRMWQGDGLFVHEWNLSSFSSFLLMPLMYIYMAIVGTTEGILLNFRYIFTAVQGICACVIYFKLKRYNWFGALAAAVTFFLYAPFGIMSLSYNSMGIQCMALALLLVLTNEKRKKIPYIFSGIFFAASVLCCPYLVAVYILYTVLVIINTAQKGCFELDVFKMESWLWITAGVAGLAVLFLGFALSRASVSQIITALQWMLNDPQHEAQSIASVVKRYIVGILKCNDISLYIFAAFAALAALRLFMGGKKISDALFFCAGAVLCGLMMAPFVTWQLYINSTLFPVNVFAAFCMLLTDNKTVKKLFKLVWIPGMLYGICIHFASTEGFLNISSVSLISLMASLVIVVMVGMEVIEKSTVNFLNLLAVCAIAAVLVMQIGATAYTRYQSVFWESGIWGDGMPAQTKQLLSGPEKGILVTDEKEEIYKVFMEDASAINAEHAGENVVYISQHTWLYLISEDARCASFSAWLPGLTEEEMKNTMDRLEAYIGLNADKTPQVIYAEEKYENLADDFAALFDCTKAATANGNYIYTR